MIIYDMIPFLKHDLFELSTCFFSEYLRRFVPSYGNYSTVPELTLDTETGRRFLQSQVT